MARMEITEELIEIFEACEDLDGEIDPEECNKCPYSGACLEYFTGDNTCNN